MSKNIYVGNLPWKVTDDELREMFEAYGTVSRAEVIIDRATGRSRGFGFVEMEIDSEAAQAIDALNEADMEGRPLTVNEAREREDRGSGGGGGGRPRGGGGGRGGHRGGRSGYGGGGGYPGGTNRGRDY